MRRHPNASLVKALPPAVLQQVTTQTVLQKRRRRKSELYRNRRTGGEPGKGIALQRRSLSVVKDKPIPDGPRCGSSQLVATWLDLRREGAERSLRQEHC